MKNSPLDMIHRQLGNELDDISKIKVVVVAPNGAVVNKLYKRRRDVLHDSFMSLFDSLSLNDATRTLTCRLKHNDVRTFEYRAE